MTPQKKTAAILSSAGALAVLAALVTLAPRLAGPTAPVRTNAAPAASDTLTVTSAAAHAAMLVGGTREGFVRYVVTAKEAPGRTRSPLNFVLVLDRSGSMAGAKLEQAKQAALGLVERLATTDRVAVVIYDTFAEVLVASTPATAANKQSVLAAIRGLRERGSTNLEGGLRLAQEEVARGKSEGSVDRIVLLSDGIANVGDSSVPGLTNLARSIRQQTGAAVSSVGIGLDFNHDLMEQLAEVAAGSYTYLRDEAGLAEVFQRELEHSATAAARAVTLTLQPAARIAVTDVYGYAFTRQPGGAVSVALPDLHAGAAFQLVLRIEAPADVEGRLAIAEASVDYVDLLRDRSRQVAVAPPVAVEVVASTQRVEESQDRDALAEVVRMQSAQAMTRAAELLQAGRTGEAREVAMQAKGVVQKQAVQLKKPSLQAMSNDFDSVFGDEAFQLGTSANRHAMKAGKAMKGMVRGTGKQ